MDACVHARIRKVTYDAFSSEHPPMRQLFVPTYQNNMKESGGTWGRSPRKQLLTGTSLANNLALRFPVHATYTQTQCMYLLYFAMYTHCGHVRQVFRESRTRYITGPAESPVQIDGRVPTRFLLLVNIGKRPEIPII